MTAPNPETQFRIPALLDEVFAPKTSAKTGRPYYKAAVRVPGEGVGEIFLTQDDFTRLARSERDTPVELVYAVFKRGGTFEPSLRSVELA